MPNGIARPLSRTADSVMFSVPRRAVSPHRQEVRLAWALKGMIDPRRDIPDELQHLCQINFGACPILGSLKNRSLLIEAVEAFKSGLIFSQTPTDGFIKDDWAGLSGLIRGKEATLMFHQNGRIGENYLGIFSGDELVVFRRLGLGDRRQSYAG